MKDAEATIGNLIDHQKVAFISSIDGHGYPNTKAMLLGTMEVLEDSIYKEMIWREGDTMYYPQGVTDPDYCVLRFTAMQGRFYNSFSSENFNII